MTHHGAKTCKSHWALSLRMAWLALGLACAALPSIYAQDLGLGDEDDAFLEELADEANPKDYEWVRVSHITDVRRWDGVRPVRGAGVLNPQRLAGVVIDDDAAEQTGEWSSITRGAFVGRGFLRAANTAGEQKVLRFTAKLPPGKHDVRLAYTVSRAHASNALVRIRHAGGVAEVRVNQREKPPILGVLGELGTFSFGDQPAVVEVSTDGSDGMVVGDAVQFLPAGAKEPPYFTWKAGSGKKVSPIADGPATTRIRPPEDGAYRIWLHYLAKPGSRRRLTLALSGANQASHVYGERPVNSHDTGKEQEKKLPVRFESEAARVGIPNREVWVWEYWDATLKAGTTLFALSSASSKAQVDTLFLSRSKDFVPSKSTEPFMSTANRTYYRFRVAKAAKGQATSAISSRMTYHWRWIERGNTQPTWYSSLERNDQHIVGADGEATFKVGEWSDFLDVTYSISTPGPWATAVLSFSDVPDGTAELQIAWWKHEKAVLKTVRPRIQGSRALFLIPLDRGGYSGALAAYDDKEGAWGMRRAGHLDLLKTAMDVFHEHASYAKAAIEALPVKTGVTPQRILFATGNGAAPGARAETTRMLRRIGINNIGRASPELIRELGLRDERRAVYQEGVYSADTHCPTDPRIAANCRATFESAARRMEKSDKDARAKITQMKLGDEIGAIRGPSHVNVCSDCLSFYHEFLAAELKETGRTPAFFGVEDLTDLLWTSALPPNPGRFERRLYFHGLRFKFALTAQFYQRMTRAAEKVFPNVRTYCNFSPHPPMFGGNMNHSDWFALTRLGGCTMGWAEDWCGGGGSWAMAGVQTVGYYGALVECASRKQNLPAGFFVVTSMSAADRRIFTLLPHGIFNLQIYSFGPRYAGAEFSNFWDGRAEAYKEVASATHAIGPADEIIAEGVRQPRRAALLYNRTHEVWQNSYGGFQTDRLLTFIAMKHAQTPVDIIIEEDLTAATLAPYRVLYLQGFNLAARHLQAIRQWVEGGGVLVATAGAATHNEYNMPNPEAAAFLGAKQRPAGVTTGSWHALSIPSHKPLDTLTLDETALTPAMAVDVVGVKYVLEPTTGKAVGRFADGSCGAALREVGKGQVLLLGIMPGLIYKGTAGGSNKYMLERLPLLAKPVLATVGTPRATHTEPQVEVSLFEHESGIAITLMDAAWKPGEPGVLSVAANRKIKEVVSTLRGPLKWQEKAGRIEFDCPVPEPVDVVILR